MRAPKAIGLYVFAVICLGALLAPWLFWTVQFLGPHVTFVRSFARYPFHRIFDRSLMVVALVGLWPLLRAVDIRSWRGLGYVRASGWWRHVLVGLIFGAASLLILTAVMLIWSGRALPTDKSMNQMLAAIVKYIFVGAVVSLIEETFFRGVVQGAFQRGMNVVIAVILASGVYSAAHFLKPYGVVLSSGEVTWSSGFTCLDWIATQSWQHKDAPITFVTLFLVGCVLGLAYIRTGAIYLPLGLHAGFVWANEFVRWYGTGAVIDHMESWAMLVVMLVVTEWLCRTKLKPLNVPGLSSSVRLTA